MYNSHLDFHSIPFSLESNPKHFFFGISAGNIFNSLISAISANQSLIALTGASGIGKSLLVRRIASKMSKRCKTLIPDYRFTNFEDFVDYIHANLSSASVSSKQHTDIEQINDLLRAEKDHGFEHIVLVVDDAHDLAPDVLEQLIYLCHPDNDPIIQIVLVGLETLDSNLKRVQLALSNEPIECCYLLEGLKEREIPDYIDHCLRVAGHNGQQIFSIGAIEQLWQFTAGRPKAINILSGLALLDVSMDGDRVVTTKVIERVADHCIFSQKLGVAQVSTLSQDEPKLKPAFRILNAPTPSASLQQRYRELGIPNPMQHENTSVSENIEPAQTAKIFNTKDA